MYVRVDDVAKEIEFDDLTDYMSRYEVVYNDAGRVCEKYVSESAATERVDALRAVGIADATYQNIE